MRGVGLPVTLDLKTVAIVGAAVAAPMLTGRMGASAGPSNKAAATALARTVAGTQFAVPANANMEDAWDAMRSALGARVLKQNELADVCRLWLDAWRAGCAAQKAGLVSDSTTQLNYSLWVSGPAAAFLDCEDKACSADQVSAGDFSPVGRAVCPVRAIYERLLRSSLLFGFDEDDQDEVYRRTRALALAMDAADFVRTGERRSDREMTSLTQLPGRVVSYAGDLVGGLLGSIASGVLGSPVVLVALGVGGYLVYRQVSK
jgi:hypothetical protein